MKAKMKINAWNNLPDYLPPDKVAEMLDEYKKTGDQKIREEIALNMRQLIIYIVRTHMNADSVYNNVFTQEDLYQECMAVTVKAIDKFVKSDYNFSFSTYLGHQLRGYFHQLYMFINRKKRVGVVKSLSEKLSPSFEKSKSFEELNIYKINFDNIMHDKLDAEFIKDKIMPLLSKEEREIFNKYFTMDLPLEKLDKRLSREGNRRKLMEIIEKVERLYDKGITEADIGMKGVSLSNPQRRAFIRAQAILKKYGRDFLQEVFLPRLSKRQAEIFKDNVLNFDGHIGIDAHKTLQGLEEKLRMMEPELKRYKFLKEETPLKQKQKKERNRRLIEEYGGDLFLRKYFLPILSEQERKVFKLSVLNYTRGTHEDLYKKAEMSASTYDNTLAHALNKLKTADFEVLVEVVDNAKQNKNSLKSTSIAVVNKVKVRQDLVKKYGGKDFLSEIFTPLLPDSQKEVFEKLFLYPHFFTYGEIADELGRSVANIISTEKTITEKLKDTNFRLLRKINNEVEEKLKNEECSRIRDAKNKAQNTIKKFGGREFLLENFAPLLKVKAQRVIFEQYMCGFASKDALEKRFHLRSDHGTAYFNQIVNRHIPEKLQVFKESFGSEENFQKAVKDFYVAKEYENQNDKKMKEEKRLLSDEEVEKYGGKRLLGRKFLRTLPVLDQLILYASLFKNKNLSEIKKELKLTYADMNYHTKQIKSKLEKFKEENEKK